MRTPNRSALFLIAACAISAGARAHTGHGAHSMSEGLLHPFGLDHLLAMVAVGVWSVNALPENKMWQGPATFMAALIVSAVLGANGVRVPYLEHAIALSVALFGAMLVFAAKPVPKRLGLTLIAAAAALHGLAHGAEAPESGFLGYVAGFLLTTGVLHTSGVTLGLTIRRWLAERSTTVISSLGALLGFTGIYLFAQV